MATANAKRPLQQASGSYNDYIPDDFADFGDLFTDDEQSGARSKSAKTQQSKADGTAGLGIDEEVSVKKRAREPRVKLDESRLLSAKGILALRSQARVLKLKGRGHEFSDASRLLSMYQLWLDDLFPKARFVDALAMVEKEGHKSSMHKIRMEWINEAKPRDLQDNDDESGLAFNEQSGEPEEIRHLQPEQQQLESENAGGLGLDSVPDELFRKEDLYDASLTAATHPSQIQSKGNVDTGQVPDESELDSLMAEAMEVHGPEEQLPPPRPALEEDFDDLEALIAEAETAT